MNAKTNARIVVQLLIALGVYTLFDAESLAENWKQQGAPAALADSLYILGKSSGLAGAHSRIRNVKDGYQDIDVAACLHAMHSAHDDIPAQDQPGSKADVSSSPAPQQALQALMTPEMESCTALNASDQEPASSTTNLPVRNAAGSDPETSPMYSSAGDDDRKDKGNDAAQVLLAARDDSKANPGIDEASSASASFHDAGQTRSADIPEPAKQTAAGTDLPESDRESYGEKPATHESLPKSPQALAQHPGSGSREALENDPAEKALRELMIQQIDPDARPLPHTDNAGAGYSGDAERRGAMAEVGGGDGPHTVSDLLRKTYYTHIESPAQEYKRRTERKVMFDKPLSKNYTVLLAGDSFMEEMTLSVGRGSYYRKSGIVFHSIARYSTGLTSIKDWNWQEKLSEGIEKYKPDIVLILLGANDMMSIVLDKKILAYKSRNWEDKYRERAEAILDTALDNNVMPIWIGLPVMTHEPFRTGIPIISRLQEEACANRNTVFVSTLKTLADENGEYQAYRMDDNGRKLRLRKKDKCHIAADGMLLVLDEVMPYIRCYVGYREAMDKPSQSEKED